MDNRFKPGDTVQHFKREMLEADERETNKYLYEIIGVATHSETREPMMVYRPLYEDGGMYVRPLEMFLSEVDREKYPDVKQKYRFEIVPAVPLKPVHDTVQAGGSNGHEYVDLGLSVMWATVNIGAAEESDPGDYFAWGETDAKDEYSWNNYKYGPSAEELTKYNNADRRFDLEAADDAAAVNWGGTWRMPTSAEWEELCDPDNCKWEWTTTGNSAGCRITGKRPGFTDKSIFLPAGGYCSGREIKGCGSAAYYWSAIRNGPFTERALCLYFIENFVGVGNNGFRNGGFTVRPVIKKQILHVPEGTVHIGNRYFSGRNDFTAVTFPGSVQDLGVGAFADCTSLETIALPAGMNRIRKELFSGCTSLRDILVPTGVRSIGEWAFRGCRSLETIELPDSISDIAAEAFLSCPCLTVVSRPGSYAESFALKHGIPHRKKEK